MNIGQTAFVVRSNEIFEAKLVEVVSAETSYFQRSFGSNGKMIAIKNKNVFQTQEDAQAVFKDAQTVCVNTKSFSQPFTHRCCGQAMTQTVHGWVCDECDSVR